MAKSYLIDKYLVVNDSEEKLLSVLKITERLSAEIYIAKICCSMQ